MQLTANTTNIKIKLITFGTQKLDWVTLQNCETISIRNS